MVNTENHQYVLMPSVDQFAEWGSEGRLNHGGVGRTEFWYEDVRYVG
jgi:hypothetical protein